MQRPFKKQNILPALLLVILTLFAACSGGGGGGSLPPPPAPLASSSLSAVAGNGSVTVTWSAVTGATSYFVYSSLSSPVSRATATKHTVSGNTFVDTGLTNGVPYYYVMTSVKSGSESPDSSEVSAVPGTTGNITGKITYEDKELNASGFTDNRIVKAVRYAAVDVVNVANPAIPLYTTWTNSLGMYSIPTSTGSTSVYIRVNSEALPTGGSQPITVTNLSNAKHSVPSTSFTLAGSANVNIIIPTTNAAAGAFNILDVMTTGYEFIKYLSGSYPAVTLKVFWYPGNPYGTFYCTGCTPGDGIYVLSQTGGDTDEYDDDVLWHEFGHFVASTYSLDQSPGGPHMLGDNEQDLRFSWSEGWGNFFPGAVKTWLFTSDQSSLISSAPGVSLTTYVDTSATGGFSFDFGNPSPIVSSAYASNEVAVAKLLTDLNTALDMPKIWSVVTNFQSSPPLDTQPVNLELFYDRWKSKFGDPTASIYTDRLIYYSDDTFEMDNDIASAQTITVNDTSQNRKLYSSAAWPGDDADYVMFSASSGSTYTITTSALLNGADTYLTLYNDVGSEISASASTRDNANGIIWVQYSNYDFYDSNWNWIAAPLNNATNLRSRIVWTAPTTGTYYVQVSPSLKRPKSAGRYGSYSLTITSP